MSARWSWSATVKPDPNSDSSRASSVGLSVPVIQAVRAATRASSIRPACISATALRAWPVAVRAGKRAKKAITWRGSKLSGLIPVSASRRIRSSPGQPGLAMMKLA